MYCPDGFAVNDLLLSEEYADLYRGTDPAGRPVLIRLAHGDASSVNADRLRHEYRICHRVAVEGMLRPVQWIPEGERSALVLEPFSGVPLSNCIGSSVLEVKDLLRLFVNLAQALSELHCQSLLHKDIRPHTILFDPETFEVKFTGFGIVTTLERQRLEPGSASGGLVYMSPEQTGQLSLETDARSDLYSLGAAFYESACGKRPFGAESLVRLMYEHLALVPPFPETLRPDLPWGLSRIIMTLLEKSPSDRYQTAEELREDLELFSEKLSRGEADQFTPSRRAASGPLQSQEAQPEAGGSTELPALGKVRQLAKAFPVSLALLSSESAQGVLREYVQSLTETSGSLLDLSALMEASQAISEGGQFDRLLDRLLSIIMEYAGSDKGALILCENQSIDVYMRSRQEQDESRPYQRMPLEEDSWLPKSVVDYVIQTSRRVLLNDVSSNRLFQQDPYIQSRCPESLLCWMVQDRNDRKALMYLENSRIAVAFESNLQPFLELLTTQAIVSIENATLLEEASRLQQDFEGLIQQNPDMVILHREGVVRYINKEACRILDCTDLESPVGQSLLEYVLPADRPDVEALIRGEASFWTAQEIRFVRSGGGHVVVSVTPVQDIRFGEERVGMLLGRDITAQRKLEQEIVQISTQEQQRIARDLHDSVGQDLAALSFKVKRLERIVERGSLPDVADIQEIQALANQAAQQTRTLALGMDPVELDRDGLVLALQNLAELTREVYEVECRVVFEESLPQLNKFASTHLYRIAQEAVGNACRHGNPEKIDITCAQNDDKNLVLSIADDGCGILAKEKGMEGAGLRNMNYRARMINGTLRIFANEWGGITVNCACRHYSLKDPEAEALKSDLQADVPAHDAAAIVQLEKHS